MTGALDTKLLAQAPITIADVRDTADRLRSYLPVTPFRNYPMLDGAIGHGIRVFVKMENHQPTGSFKARNGLALMTSLSAEQRRQGVIAATKGNHGMGLAYGGSLLGVRVTIVAPSDNVASKNDAMRALGAELILEGADYDEATTHAAVVAKQRGQRLAHSTNDIQVLAGAGTMTLEMLGQEPDLDALVLAVGGGSQAVGAIVVAQALRPQLRIYGVQAAGAAAYHDSWHARERRTYDRVNTFADGIATRGTYDLSFPTLLDGLSGFVTVSDGDIGDAVRLLQRVTHQVAEGAGAASLAGAIRLRDRLAGQRVGVVLTGAVMDAETIRKVFAHEL